MAPASRSRFRFFACLLVAASLGLAAPAHALRLVNYNVTNYPSVNFPARQPYFRTVFAPLNADIVVVQEMRSQAGVDSFRTNVLNVLEPGQWASAQFFDGGDTDNALFYKPSKVQVLGAWAFYPYPTYSLRFVTVWRLKPVGYGSSQAEFRIYSQHLKASQGSQCTGSFPNLPCETDRLNEAIGIRDSMNAMPAGTHGIVLGDFNFYNSSTEPAYLKLQESQANNIGRVLDPQNQAQVTQNWHNNAAFVNVHTQCPCVTCPSGSGFSGGGLDDRFDQILPTYNWYDGEGLNILPSTYVVVGQDGQHFNKNITDAPTIPEGATYATALWNASDHLPIRVDLSVPAKISASTTPIAFGTVIVGATASQNLLVANSAIGPCDTLEYTYGAPVGFTAPGGNFALLEAHSSSDAIGMNTASAGIKSGSLGLNSNDVDFPALLIPLSGTVLDHAAVSLDSASVVLGDSLVFGTHEAGGFTDRLARLHNFGYDPLQAQLSVSAASITGPDAARFSLVSGFSPVLIAETGAGWNVHFDDAGASAGSHYEATLTFTSADEPLPGATAQPAAAYTLSADVATASTAVRRPGLPTATRLYSPFPNPLRGASTLNFDLARAATMRLEVFDLSGRRIATLASGPFDAGAYSISWDGRRSDGSTAGAGLYFIRMSGREVPTGMARLAIVR
jgi:hypothetical protein